jgi:hypothetical protein
MINDHYNDAKNSSAEPALHGGVLAELRRIFLVRPVLWWQEQRCAAAKAYLLTHDRHFRGQYIGNEIVRQREQLYAAGVSPDDPRVPDWWSVEKSLPPMSWPRTNRF